MFSAILRPLYPPPTLLIISMLPVTISTELSLHTNHTPPPDTVETFRKLQTK